MKHHVIAKLLTSALLPAFLITGCGSSPKPAAVEAAPVTPAPAPVIIAAPSVSDAQLLEYAQQIINGLDNNNKVAAKKNKYTARLAKLSKGFAAKDDGQKLNFRVYLDKELNAFAAPDGSIRVYSGLMDKLGDNELRGIVGHLVGHVKLGHALQATRVAYLSTKEANAGGTLGAGGIEELTEKFLDTSYSESVEAEADAYSVEFLVRNKIKPKALATAWHKLAKLEASLTISHPNASERADALGEPSATPPKPNATHKKASKKKGSRKAAKAAQQKAAE
ncbi:MAG: M48 family metalloprotease [Azoarcus sp.]|jgi:putative metalloprotease|nr:M48 family metalloprotease [Azoarcus sp.]